VKIYLDTNENEKFMKPSALKKENKKLIELGWHALVEKLGIVNATKFIMTIDKGEGDSVRYFRDLWKDKTSEEIYKEMIEARK